MMERINIKSFSAVIAFLILIPLSYAGGSMSFLLHYDKGDVSLLQTDMLERSPPDFIYQPETGFSAGITSFNGSVLFARRFEFPLKNYDSTITLDETDYALIVPYFNTGRYFFVFDKDEKQIIKADLSEYAVCNENGVCNTDYGETLETCEEDCKAGMPVEEEKLPETPSAEQEPEEVTIEEPVAFNKDYLIIGALALVFIIIVIALLASRKKGSTIGL